MFTGLTSFTFANEGPVYTKISSVTNLNYDGRYLSGTYMTGGGCEQHTPVVEVMVDVEALNQYLPGSIRIELYDHTPYPDYCEAILYVDFRFDLKQEVTYALETIGIDEYYGQYDVVLPEVTVNFYP